MRVSSFQVHTGVPSNFPIISEQDVETSGIKATYAHNKLWDRYSTYQVVKISKKVLREAYQAVAVGQRVFQTETVVKNRPVLEVVQELLRNKYAITVTWDETKQLILSWDPDSPINRLQWVP